MLGYDNDSNRVNKLNQFIDKTNEVTPTELKDRLMNNLIITDEFKKIKDCNIYIITVPTPIDNLKTPDLSYLLDATKTVGKMLSINDIVIYESTVYPGCTEEKCVPLLEKISGLKYNKDFYCGYYLSE